MIDQLTRALGVPRDALASNDEIEHAWKGLPRVLERIPPELRTEQHMRMCVAVACGLLDAAVNYAWNSAVVVLRSKVRHFGLHVVPQLTNRSFDEQTLNDLKDAELLGLCLSLNLIDEDGFFFLSQCREIRNNFSSAHPPMGTLDDHEFLTFLNRCAKYALSSTTNPQGVDTRVFLEAVKGDRFQDDQLDAWFDRLVGTHDAQRELLVGTLHGIYCDPDSSEEARVNAQSIVARLAPRLTALATSTLINRHNDYVARGDNPRQNASRDFFTKLGLLALLSDAERHGIVSRACSRLLSVHDGFDNFHNEPPFAKRLLEISEQGAIPASAQAEFVGSVALCAVGNQYGVSWSAQGAYERLIKNFSPKEVALLLDAATKHSRLSRRIKEHGRCKKRFTDLVNLIDASTVPATHKKTYETLLAA